MNRKFIYYIIFAISFLLFSIVQDYIRPNYDGANGIIIYLLGVAPNFLPGIGLPALLYVVIPEVSKPNSSLFKNRLYWSVGISISGLIANEFITIFTPGRGVFDWNDILWTIIGAGLFTLTHKKFNKIQHRSLMKENIDLILLNFINQQTLNLLSATVE